MNNICHPLPQGKRAEIGDLISSLVDYHSAGQYRRDLASKMIYAQIALARAGFSTGGRAVWIPPLARKGGGNAGSATCRW